MKKEDLPDVIKRTMEFEETSVEHVRAVCPKCENKSVDRNLYKHQNWYVDMCTTDGCPYHTCGFIDKELK